MSSYRPATTAAVSLMFVLVPTLVMGETTVRAAPSDAGHGRRERLNVQVAAGPTLIGGGNVLSGAFGHSPASWLELLLNVERIHLPSRFDPLPVGFAATRGGTLTFVSGELRVALPRERVSPFATAGIGGGVSRPNVNARFPERVTNDLRVLYVGGGVRVRLRGRFSLTGDARAMLALERGDSVLAVWPVRAGVAWHF